MTEGKRGTGRPKMKWLNYSKRTEDRVETGMNGKSF
jgi:hypothetical protein